MAAAKPRCRHFGSSSPETRRLEPRSPISAAVATVSGAAMAVLDGRGSRRRTRQGLTSPSLVLRPEPAPVASVQPSTGYRLGAVSADPRASL